MNFDKYKNTLSYPAKEQFTTKFWYKNGKVVAERRGDEATITHVSGLRMEECVLEKVVDEAALKAARLAYGQETAKLTDQFKADLFKDLGITHHPMREKLYSKAWENGHSAGLSEVYNVAYDLVDLIKVPQGFVLVGTEVIMFGGLSPSAEADRVAKRLAKELEV